jgi:hypothetical protein
MLLIMLKNFNKNYRNISIFTSISYHSVFTRALFLFFQHSQQHDALLTLLPITPCTHKLKDGIAYNKKKFYQLRWMNNVIFRRIKGEIFQASFF